MGSDLNWLLDLSTLIKVNVIIFEYSGFGEFKHHRADKTNFIKDAAKVVQTFIDHGYCDLDSLIV